MDAMDRKCVDLKASIAEQNKLISDLQETYDDKQAQKDATDESLAHAPCGPAGQLQHVGTFSY